MSDQTTDVFVRILAQADPSVKAAVDQVKGDIGQLSASAGGATGTGAGEGLKAAYADQAQAAQQSSQAQQQAVWQVVEAQRQSGQHLVSIAQSVKAERDRIRQETAAAEAEANRRSVAEFEAALTAEVNAERRASSQRGGRQRDSRGRFTQQGGGEEKSTADAIKEEQAALTAQLAVWQRRLDLQRQSLQLQTAAVAGVSGVAAQALNATLTNEQKSWDTALQHARNVASQMQAPLEAARKAAVEAAGQKAAAEEDASRRTVAAAGTAGKAQDYNANNVRTNAELIARAYEKIRGNLGSLGAQIVSQTIQWETLAVRMRALTHDTGLARAEMERLGSARVAVGTQDLVEADLTIRKLGDDVKQVEPLVLDLAATFGKTAKEEAAYLERSLSGNARAMMVLRQQFGVTRTQLEELGVQFSTSGALSVKSAADVEHFRSVVTRILTEKSFGAAAEQLNTLGGAATDLGNRWAELIRKLGDAAGPLLTGVTQAGASLVSVLSSIPTPLLALVEGVAAAAAGMGALAAIAAAFEKTLPVLITGLEAAAGALSLSVGGVLAFGGALGITLGIGASVIGWLKSYTDAQLDAEKTAWRAAEAQRDHNTALLDLQRILQQQTNPAELVALGVTAGEVGQAIEGLRDKARHVVELMVDVPSPLPWHAELQNQLDTIRQQIDQLGRLKTAIEEVQGLPLSTRINQDARTIDDLIGRLRTGVSSGFGQNLTLDTEREDDDGHGGKQKSGFTGISKTALTEVESRLKLINAQRAAGLYTAQQEVEAMRQVLSAMDRLEQTGAKVDPSIAEAYGEKRIEVEGKIRKIQEQERKEEARRTKEAQREKDEQVNEQTRKDTEYFGHLKALNQVSADEAVEIARRRLAKVQETEFGTDKAKSAAVLAASRELDSALKAQSNERVQTELRDADTIAAERVAAAGRSKEGQVTALKQELAFLEDSELRNKPAILRKALELRKEITKTIVEIEEEAEKRVVENFIRQQDRYLKELEKRPRVAADVILAYVQAQASEATARADALVKQGISENDSRVQALRKQAEKRNEDAELQREKMLQRALDIETHIRDVRKQELDFEIDGLKKRIVAGENVEANIIEKVKERIALELAAIEEKKQKDLDAQSATTAEGIRARQQISEAAGEAEARVYAEAAKNVQSIMDSIKQEADRVEQIYEKHRADRTGGRRSPIPTATERAEREQGQGDEQGELGDNPGFDFSLRLPKRESQSYKDGPQKKAGSTDKLQAFTDQLGKSAAGISTTFDDVRKGVQGALAVMTQALDRARDALGASKPGTATSPAATFPSPQQYGTGRGGRRGVFSAEDEFRRSEPTKSDAAAPAGSTHVEQHINIDSAGLKADPQANSLLEQFGQRMQLHLNTSLNPGGGFNL